VLTNVTHAGGVENADEILFTTPFCSATTTVTGVDSLGGRWLPA